jgi:Tol biopolymer transport system component
MCSRRYWPRLVPLVAVAFSVLNAFPMFSYDGKKLIFSSNRNNGGTRDTNLFLADWKD